MIISHKHKFIFVRTRKTAGTSTELALSQLLDDEDIITPFCPRDEKLRIELKAKGPQNYLEKWSRYRLKDIYLLVARGERKMRFYNHIPAEAIRRLVGSKLWQSYYKFCFERNPWDKVISLYYHRFKSEPRPPLYEFIRSRQCAAAFNFGLYTSNEEIILDHIGRYENLEYEFNFICRKLGLPTVPSLPRAKSQFRKDHRHYREVLSQEEKEIISRIFSKEIEQFNYEF